MEKTQLLPKMFTFVQVSKEVLACDLEQNLQHQIDSAITLTFETENTVKKSSRKRSLEHLTYEERLLRKKLKNREAAQTSRDKKKAKMEDLEKALELLTRQNEELQNDLELVKMEKLDVQRENERLREELHSVTSERPLECPDGSAVSSRNPLPKGNFHSRTSFLTLAILSILLHCSRKLLTTAFGTGSSQKAWTHSPRTLCSLMSSYTTSTPCLKYPNQRNLEGEVETWSRHHRLSWNPPVSEMAVPVT